MKTGRPQVKGRRIFITFMNFKLLGTIQKELYMNTQTMSPFILYLKDWQPEDFLQPIFRILHVEK